MSLKRTFGKSLGVVIAVFVALGAVPARTDAALLTASQLAELQRSIVRVEAQCGGNGSLRIGTGFLWSSKDTAITSLHTVAGCQSIFVYYELSGGHRSPAHIVRVLKSADIVLLQIASPSNVPALTRSPVQPQLHDQFETVGYGLAIPKMEEYFPLTYRFGGNRIKDIVSPDIASNLQTLGFPDVNLVILNLDGQLVPGLSGAPIVDSSARVVAIGDGGLERGAASSSWAIPISQVDALASSSEAPPNVSNAPQSARPDQLFSADFNSQAGEQVACGGVTLTKVRVMRFADLARSSDDQGGLRFILSLFALNLSSAQYTVYQDLKSGATVVVPSDAKLMAVSDRCVAELGPALRMQVQVRAANGNADMQAEAVEFERLSLQPDSVFLWQEDPAYSYAAPETRFDGLIVRRKTAVRQQFPQALLFETLAGRNGTFVGASMIYRNYNSAAIAAQLQCQAGSPNPICAQVMREKQAWARMVMGVALTTFPAG